jgi:uncharacterized membrane protein
MFNQAVVRTGFRFGLFGALAGFVLILFLYFVGANPYGQLSWWSWLAIPAAVFWGLNYYKRKFDPELGFLQAFVFGTFISLILALFSAILLLLFGSLIGDEALQRHIAEMKTLFGQTSAQALKDKVLTPETIASTNRIIESTTLKDVVLDVFLKSFFIGVLTSVVGAVFSRK